MDTEHEAENLFLCATNEGELYPIWVSMAKDRFNVPDGEWTAVLRPYYHRIIREKRAGSDMSARELGRVAMRLRDYYIEHVKEGAGS